MEIYITLLFYFFMITKYKFLVEEKKIYLPTYKKVQDHKCQWCSKYQRETKAKNASKSTNGKTIS